MSKPYASAICETVRHPLQHRSLSALEHRLRRVRFDDLRHAFGTGAIPYVVQSYMGHLHYSTTHHRPRREDAAASEGDRMQ